MTTQPDLFSAAEENCDLPPGITAADRADFRAALMSAGACYLTRKELCSRLGWDARKLRLVAQSLGGAVVRCQIGFKLRALCTRDDLSYMQQAADAAGSQSRIQRAYELEMLRAIHALVG